VEEAKAIFASVPNPDKIAYDQYINLLAKAGRAQDACDALEAMKARGVEISHYAYSGVVLAYCNSGGDDGVLRKEKIMGFLKVGFGFLWVWRVSGPGDEGFGICVALKCLLIRVTAMGWCACGKWRF
jgi:pentatricopeptide repeat protein